MALHQELSGTENHVPHAFSYANATARLAAAGFTSSDIGKLALDEDTYTFHVLKSDSPVTWIAVGGSPSGLICMWSGSVASVPTGWALCDGTNGTPNLQDRFIVGAGSSYQPGDTGGTSSVTLANANLPAHTHTFSGVSSSNGSHSHTVTVYYTGSGTAGIIQMGKSTILPSSYATSSVGNHEHTYSGTTSSVGSGSAFSILPPYYALAYIMKL